VPAWWPVGVHRTLEGIPDVSSDLLPSVRQGDIEVKPAIDRLLGDRVRFVDRSEEAVDRIVYATGYRISLPLLWSSLVSASGRDFPLYRRIVPPNVGGLFFVGFVDAPGGLLPVVEAQAEWIAAVLTGRLSLPSPSACVDGWSGPNGAPASASPRRIPRASSATLTATGGCCARISAGRGVGGRDLRGCGGASAGGCERPLGRQPERLEQLAADEPVIRSTTPPATPRTWMDSAVSPLASVRTVRRRETDAMDAFFS
jgi:Flavin-binding monooxygenase-like